VKGLRTLMLGRKHLTEEEYKKWNEEYVKAKSTIGDKREEAIDKCYERIEKNLELVGATAI
jgi:phospholipid-translocating ATPase